MIKKIFNRTSLLSLLNLLIFISYSLLLVFLIELICRGSYSDTYEFFTQRFSKVTYNVLIVSLTLSPCFLFKRRTFAFSIVSILWIILSIADNLVIKFRETPLTYADLGMIKSGLELSNQYLSKNSFIIIISAFVFIILGLTLLFFKCKKTTVKYLINIVCLLVFLLTFSFSVDYGLEKGIITTNFWDANWGYSHYGFSYSFYNSFVNTGINKPSSYSKNTINEIKDELDTLAIENSDSLNAIAISIDQDSDLLDVNFISESNDNIIKPNIIMIQLESFINPNWLTNVTFNENPVSNLESYSQSFSSGLVTVPSFGGGTANTEFEVITGMSTEFFGVGEYPYNTIASKAPIPSLAYTLRDLGYTSNSLHNHEGKFYSRYKVYENLGFDAFTPIELMSVPERTPFGWAKDNVLIDEICNIITNTDSPDLILGISVQGHGTYPNTPLEDKVISITSGYEKENKNSLEYYINQIYEMDIFINDLIEAINSLNEPSVVLFYGDHFPALGFSSDEISEADLKETPYLIWDNMNLDITHENLKAYELTSLILDKLSFPSTTLSSLHNSNLDDETKKEYLNLLEYDMIYGKNFTSEYSNLIPADDYKIGFKTVKIDSAETYNNTDILIHGENFNHFTSVYVNNKAVERTFLDSNTIAISINSCKSGDILQVYQPSADCSTIFTYSNEIIFK